jgi:WhiB family redox-sensing transcriptional regulator
MSILDVKAPGWMVGAVCDSIVPVIWFAERGNSTAPARRFCAMCPVTTKCLEWALKVEAEEGRMPGIYGGLSASERSKLTANHICRIGGCSEGIAGRGYRYCKPHSEERKAATSHRSAA